MSTDQIQALDQFYFGVGFVTTPQFAKYSERGFGSWKFFQHIKERDRQTGELIDVKTELEVSNCFAYINSFAKPSKTAKRLIDSKDVIRNMWCVDKRQMKTLHARSVEFWTGQPRYSFQFFTCESQGFGNCHPE